jgi:hypothetical protein
MRACLQRLVAQVIGAPVHMSYGILVAWI